MTLINPPRGYAVKQTDQRVEGIAPDLRTWFRWRAERRCRHLNALRRFPFYRWEVVCDGSRWLVVPFQNVAVPVGPAGNPPPERSLSDGG